MDRVTHALCVDGRVWMGLNESWRPVLETIRRNLERLDGNEHFAFLIWRLPQGKRFEDTNPQEEAVEYLQCAGSARAMTLEAQRRGSDGFEHYVVGRPANPTNPPGSVVIVWDVHQTSVRSNEAFNAEEALPVFAAYYETGWIPSSYSLRPLRNDQVN